MLSKSISIGLFALGATFLGSCTSVEDEELWNEWRFSVNAQLEDQSRAIETVARELDRIRHAFYLMPDAPDRIRITGEVMRVSEPGDLFTARVVEKPVASARIGMKLFVESADQHLKGVARITEISDAGTLVLQVVKMREPEMRPEPGDRLIEL